MRTADEHTKLARIALMFSPELDAAFGINVAKMRVTLPPELSDRIEVPVNRVVKRARAVYDAKPDPATPKRSSGMAGATVAEHGSDGGGNGRKREDAQNSDGRVAAAATITVAQVRREALETAAGAAGEQRALAKIIDALSQCAPEVARDLGF